MKNEEIRFLNEQIADARENQVNSSTLNEIQNIGPQLGVLQEAILNLESEKTALVNENSRLKQENEELKTAAQFTPDRESEPSQLGDLTLATDAIQDSLNSLLSRNYSRNQFLAAFRTIIIFSLKFQAPSRPPKQT